MDAKDDKQPLNSQAGSVQAKNTAYLGLSDVLAAVSVDCFNLVLAFCQLVVNSLLTETDRFKKETP